MKYVLVLVVVLVAAWVLMGRGRGRGRAAKSDEASKKTADSAAAAGGKPGAAAPQTMVACAHCAVHLPRAEAVADAQGRLFCDEAHRLAGPR